MAIVAIICSVLVFVILFIFCIQFYKLGLKMNSWQVVGYSLVCLLAATILLIYISNPEIIIKTPYMSIERKVDSLKAEGYALSKHQQEVTEQQIALQEVATTLTKMILVVEDGVGKFGDSRPRRDTLIAQYKKQIESLLPQGLKNQVERDIESLYSPEK